MRIRKGGVIGSTWVALAAFASLMACGDDSGGGLEDGGLEDGGLEDGAAGTSGEGGSGGGGGASGAAGGGPMGGCLDPLEQDLVFQATDLSGGVIYKVVEDDGTLYFSTVDRLFRVEASGGEPEELYFDEFAIVVKFWVRADDILILDGGDTLLSLPKEGGATTELTELPFIVRGGLDGSVAMIIDGELAYAKAAEGGFGEPVVSTFYEIDLTTYETRELGTTGEVDGAFVKAGDALYFAVDDASAMVDEDDPTAFVPELLWRLSIEGGEPEQVPLEGVSLRMAMLGTDGDSLYAIGRTDANEMLISGVFRIPTSGGTPEQVHDQIVLFALTFAIHNTASQVLLRDLDTFYDLPSTGSATKLFCVGGGAYTTHGSTATDEAVFVSLFHSDDEESFIARMPLD